jgi:mRNA interferase RelE/StbE
MSALYGFAFADTALRFLETMVPPKLRGQIKRRIEALAANPIPPGSKKLRGACGDPVYRVRQGDYRILYVVRNNPSQIVVLDIDHRKDVYR